MANKYHDFSPKEVRQLIREEKFKNRHPVCAVDMLKQIW